jgi:hypothetical protein
MPVQLDRCVQELKRKRYSESEAWAICTSIYRSNYSKEELNITNNSSNNTINKESLSDEE